MNWYIRPERRTAKAHGLAVPLTLQVGADERSIVSRFHVRVLAKSRCFPLCPLIADIAQRSRHVGSCPNFRRGTDRPSDLSQAEQVHSARTPLPLTHTCCAA